MKLFISIFSTFFIFVSSSSRNAENEFAIFKQQYNKSYDSITENSLRFQIFQTNLDYITNHNKKNLDWMLSVNEFTDLTPKEFKKYYTGLYRHSFDNHQHIRSPTIVSINNQDIPSSVDWVKNGAVTDVKNQGQCGSCWAFSAIGAIESANFIKHQKLVAFSEQQLVDCSREYGNYGCSGGLMDFAFKYAVDNVLCAEENYPYLATDSVCKSVCQSNFTIQGFVDVPPNSESELAKAVIKQPVSVAIEADTSIFQFFHSGVITSTSCGQNLDHGVLVVGFGIDKKTGIEYWKVKNSWGKNWGMDGFVYIQKNSNVQNGICGILIEPSYPLV